MRTLRLVFFGWLAVAALGATVSAHDDPDHGGNAGSPAAVDVGDLWHKVRGQTFATDIETLPEPRRFLVLTPSIGSKPSTGLTGGFSGSGAFFSGSPGTTHISSLSGGFSVTQQKQAMLGVKLALFTADDRWFILGDNRLSWTSQDTYSLGGRAPGSSAENLRFDSSRLYGTVYRNVEPGLFVGVGLNVNTHSNVRASAGDPASFNRSAYVAYSAEHGFTTEHQTSSGTSVGLRYDTRDNAINAQRGWLASATYRTFFRGVLGGDSTWQEVNLDVRTYKSLSKDGRHKIAFWFLGDLVTGGAAPYFDLPATGSDGRSARGYSEGRYRGEHLLYGEAEYRGTITRNGLVGFVAFANVTTVGSAESGDRLFGSYAPAAGVGLRVLLNKRSQTRLCADYGWGRGGSGGFYLAIQEAF
ncbi:MAG TPA: BamA/TamA family outer membrane protein [Vicinamibacterales bacterium]|jgi:outer membrane protein assembly factor BamA